MIFSSLFSNTVLFCSIKKITRRDRGCFTDILQNKSEIQWVFWIPLDGMKIWKINHMDDDKGINKVQWLSWQKNFNKSNKIFFFYSLNSLFFSLRLNFFLNFLTFMKILYHFGKKIQSYNGETVDSNTWKVLECNTEPY